MEEAKIFQCKQKCCHFQAIPKETLREIFYERKKRNKHNRDQFLEQFRWQKTKTAGKHRFHTKYKIGHFRVCHHHMTRKNVDRNQMLNKTKPSKHSSANCPSSQATTAPTRNCCTSKTSRVSKNCMRPKGIRIQKLKTDCCDKCLSARNQIKTAHGEERRRLEDKLSQHQNEARIEEDPTLTEAASIAFRLDVDPASNLNYPHFAREQVLKNFEKVVLRLPLSKHLRAPQCLFQSRHK